MPYTFSFCPKQSCLLMDLRCVASWKKTSLLLGHHFFHSFSSPFALVSQSLPCFQTLPSRSPCLSSPHLFLPSLCLASPFVDFPCLTFALYGFGLALTGQALPCLAFPCLCLACPCLALLYYIRPNLSLPFLNVLCVTLCSPLPKPSPLPLPFES